MNGDRLTVRLFGVYNSQVELISALQNILVEAKKVQYGDHYESNSVSTKIEINSTNRAYHDAFGLMQEFIEDNAEMVRDL